MLKKLVCFFCPLMITDKGSFWGGGGLGRRRGLSAFVARMVRYGFKACEANAPRNVSKQDHAKRRLTHGVTNPCL